MANATFESTADQYRALAARQISARELADYVSDVFELSPPEGDEGEGRIHESVRKAFEAGRGNDLAGVKGTWWAAYNAVTEYLSHERGRTDESRLNSLWYGDSAQKNWRALSIAVQKVTGR
jgi:hypothetical protein